MFSGCNHWFCLPPSPELSEHFLCIFRQISNWQMSVQCLAANSPSGKCLASKCPAGKFLAGQPPAGKSPAGQCLPGKCPISKYLFYYGCKCPAGKFMTGKWFWLEKLLVEKCSTGKCLADKFLTSKCPKGECLNIFKTSKPLTVFISAQP